MSVSSGTVIKLQNLQPGVTRIIPPPRKKPGSGFLLSFLGTLLSIALVPIIGPESLAGTVFLESVAIGGDLGFQAGAAAIEGRSLDPTTALFSIVGGGAAALSVVKAANTIKKTERTLVEIADKASSDGFNSLERQVLIDNVQKVVTERFSAQQVQSQLIRAGLSEPQAIEQLEKVAQIARNNGLNLNRFNDELSFINQETKIFQELNGVANKYGFELNDVFSILSDSGIDVVGIRNTDQLVNTIRRSSQSVENLRGSQLLSQLEGALERDLEPTLFTRVLNAQNAEKAATKVNKLLSLSNPNTLITEITNKIFDPLKSRISSKIADPLKKKAQQKLKHLLRQDLIRKQETKNGVYPAFGSSFINYIRSIPLGKGVFKAGVTFRKWGYSQVIITPTLTLQFIIGWSESTSPGRIYHKFREEYGGPKGQTTVDGDAGFKANTAAIFNLLGYIPDKYISLGVSLISNIAIARSVVSTHAWTDFITSPEKYIKKPLEDKVLEMVGGQAAKATRDQISGNKGAMQSYFEGKILESTESRQSAFRQESKGGRGKLDAVKGIGGIIS